MTDRHTHFLLSLVNEKSPAGEYKVLETSDMLAALPKKSGMDKDGLQKIMEYLAGEDLIVLKYSDESAYCVASTPKGRMYGEKRTEEQRKDSSQKKFMIATIVASAIGAFVGALVAILVMMPFIG